MEETNMAGDVWRRVLAGPVATSGVDALLGPALDALADYRYLAAALNGRARQEAGKLQTRQRDTVETLRGLCRLADGEDIGPRTLVQAKGPASACLRRSYHRARRAATEYTARTAEPLTGAAFRVLAAREEENCAALAQLLGMQV